MQELNEELKKEIGQSLLSKLKHYKQFEFEGNIIIVEYAQHLWFQVKLMMLHSFYIHKSSSLYAIKDSPNFSVFLKQIDAFKVTKDEDSISVSFLSDLNYEHNLKKETFVSELIKFKTEKPHELRSIIATSMNKFQKHYSNIINNLPYNDRINDVFQSDQAVIFLGKGCLRIHEAEQLPSKKIDQKVYFNQSSNQEKIELVEISDKIFSQMEKINQKHELQLESIVNAIQSFKYFTFYKQKFLLLHYTVFLKVLEEKVDGNIVNKIDDTIIQQSALFAVTSENEHELINFEGDNLQAYPQMNYLLGKQLSNIIDPAKFMKIFTEKVVHENIKPNTDIMELSGKFQLGSVLLYKSKFFTNYACVYLGSDLVITVILDEELIKKNIQKEEMSDEQAQMKGEMEVEEQKQTDDGGMQIFQFSRFEEFLQEQKSIQEIRFKFQPYDKQELFDKALQMNKSSFEFNIYKQNSEHLAFELASGLRFSPQQSHLINKIGEVFQNIFFSK